MEQLAGVTVRDLRRVFGSPNGSFTFYVDLLCRYERRTCRFLTACRTLHEGPGKQAEPAGSRLGHSTPAATIPLDTGRGHGSECYETNRAALPCRRSDSL